MKKLFFFFALLTGIVFATTFCANANPTPLPGTAWRIDFGSSLDIGCNPSTEVCCRIGAYVDKEARIHVVILDHLGKDYDIIIQSEDTEQEAIDVVVDQLESGGVTIPIP